MSMHLRLRLIAAGIHAGTLIGGVAIELAWTRPVSAQSGVEEVIVTARRREERVQDVPEAITPLTAAELDARGITDLKSVAQITPGFMLSTAGQSTRRNNQSLYVRGVKSVTAGVGTFINGAPASSSAGTSLDDLERVEVLKGPQNAYFGRATFAGAVNFVTRTPSSTWGGTVQAEIGNYHRYDVKGSIEGPLVTDAVSMRVSGRVFSQRGQYINAFDGGRVTDQTTNSVTAVVDYHKGDNLKVVLVSMYNQLRDGFPMVTKLDQRDFNCNAGAAPAGTNNYICGELPRYPESRIGMSYFLTNLPGFPVRDILFNNSIGFPNPSGVKPDIDCFCTLQRDFQNNLRVDYTFSGNNFLSGATLSYLMAVNGQQLNQMLNAFAQITTDIPNPNFGRIVGAVPTAASERISYGGYNFNIYHELRLAGDPTARLRWMAGASYTKPINRSYQMNYGVTLTGANQVNDYNNFNNTYTKPIGTFASLSYDVTETFVVNAEARYQYDRQIVRRIAPLPSIVQAQTEGWKFDPRVSLQYKMTADINSYVSWARGDQPATFNAILFTQPDAIVAQVQQATGAGKTVQGEKMDMFELGLKGRFLNDRLALNTDIYYGKWTNQVIQQRFNAVGGSGTAATVITVNTNLGETELKGWEFDANANLTDNIRTKITFAYTPATIKRYNCAACALNITGVLDVSGHNLPASPMTSGSAFIEYRNTFRGEAEWYANMQFLYAGKIYADETNLAWTAPRTTFDFRLGLDFGKAMVEAYCTNCFDAYYYDGAPRDVNFFTPAPPNALNNVFYPNPPEKRRVGIRVRMRWGAN